jgi:hypothetical protein
MENGPPAGGRGRPVVKEQKGPKKKLVSKKEVTKKTPSKGKKWRAVCGVLKPPHAIDPSTGTYMTWVGPDRVTHPEARADATAHNKNPGHSAIVT